MKKITLFISCFILFGITGIAQQNPTDIELGGPWSLNTQRHTFKMVNDLPGTSAYVITWQSTDGNYDSLEKIQVSVDGQTVVDQNNSALNLREGSSIIVEAKDLIVSEFSSNTEGKLGYYNKLEPQIFESGIKAGFRMFGVGGMNGMDVLLTKLEHERYVRIQLTNIEDNMTPALDKNLYKFSVYVDGALVNDRFTINSSMDVYGKDIYIKLNTNPLTDPVRWFKCKGQFYLMD